ncbi:uncharacterized protein [Lolium perenne]|uniref:uncharacterized protein isoform X2 n=1 Tax=Lolium perenne TaxID=4522 RepID=UPI0021F5D49A|nr:uncharacterized protein LOC127318099 isoform X2 [Lolium perenne]
MACSHGLVLFFPVNGRHCLQLKSVNAFQRVKLDDVKLAYVRLEAKQERLLWLARLLRARVREASDVAGEDADDQDFHDHEVFRMATLAGITIKYGVESQMAGSIEGCWSDA